MSEFKEFLQSKYGDDIVRELYDNGQLRGENIKVSNTSTKTMASNHIAKLFR